MRIPLSIILFCLASGGTVIAQKSESKSLTWEDKLFETDVKYGSFACKDSYKDIVDEYFKRNPLNRIINVCHNNCAVLESFPKTPMPPFDKKLLGTGFIAVHILTNEKGTPVFARALNGQSPMRAIFQARSCEATFRPLTNNRQRVLYLCVDQDCSLPQPVQ